MHIYPLNIDTTVAYLTITHNIHYFESIQNKFSLNTNYTLINTTETKLGNV